MYKIIFVTATLCSAIVLGAAAARAETDSGTAASFPWSGYWWQHKSGGLTGPLTKYDQLRKTKAAAWEQENHVNTAADDWYGHCHAWSASAVCEREPKEARSVEQIAFGVGDQKGLLAACHALDVANSFGQRYSGASGEDRNDIYPDELWRVLQMYLKQRQIPIVLDMDAGDQVWNYPVYQYQVDYEPAGDGWYNATMQLIVADDHVDPDYVGTQPSLYNYTFRFKMQDGAVVAGSGQWTGASEKDHPDFAWYPYVAVAENPDIDVAAVSKIVGFEVGGNNPPSPDNPTPPDPVQPVNPPPPDDNTTPGPQVNVQNLLSPDELVAAVLNKTSAFAFDVFVDKGDGGRYQAGQPIRISFRSAQDGYLYIFDIDPLGELSLVFPLQGQDNFIRKDQLYDLPAKDQKPWFVARGQGQHDLKAIVLTRPIQITGFQDLPQPRPPAQQRTGQQTQPQQPRQPSQQAVTTGTQKMLVPPSTEARVRRCLYRVFRKSETEEQAPPKKLGAFAQDVCSYFVLPRPGQTRPGQQQ